MKSNFVFHARGAAGAPGCVAALGQLKAAMNAGADSSSYGQSNSIVPSFFRLVSLLHQKGADFKVVFRTFGVDIPRVSEEFNAFCEGRHPHCSRFSETGSFVHMDGSNGLPDRRLRLPDRSCAIIRSAARVLPTGEKEAFGLKIAYVNEKKVSIRYYTLSISACVT